ncbi:LytTR family DNA-binding domain-containing protein [Hydrogenophaga sp.]|uniref:LytR/AlgR family response regulator transcription factor n=1 Tax=Hydrogenophaga sp. TaxID=1904254 RepID=UPI0019B7624F|nr:LytTR family DNA-binding domain-containing protein [Hydrogenophaga sp.]MBD3892858.1 response regulator transcription factor [Hydrogenophaga sp.]
MALRVLIVDDEALARSRLRSLLGECTEPRADVVGEAANAVQAMEQVQRGICDLVLLDVQMPGVDGVALASALRQLAAPPALVFVTAHAGYAVQAFELEAVDYLTKPVRRERLAQALQKVLRLRASAAAAALAGNGTGLESLLIQERGRSLRVALSEVVYLKAELKYITVRTVEKEHIFDGALSDLEQRFMHLFVRIHRNALVARGAVRALEKQHDPLSGEVWVVRLDGVDECLAVSRRQLTAVREALLAGCGPASAF